MPQRYDMMTPAIQTGLNAKTVTSNVNLQQFQAGLVEAQKNTNVAQVERVEYEIANLIAQSNLSQDQNKNL